MLSTSLQLPGSHQQTWFVCVVQDDLRGRTLPDSGERAYALSKSYMLMAGTRELARRLEGTGVEVIAGQHLLRVTATVTTCSVDQHSNAKVAGTL